MGFTFSHPALIFPFNYLPKKYYSLNGLVVGSILVSDQDDVMLITTAGKIIRTSAGGISCVGRNTMGVTLVSLDENETVAAVARVADSGVEQEEDDEEKAPDGKLFQ